MPKKLNKPKRKVLPQMHIYCEGEKTEPTYIRKYLNKFYDGDRRRELIVLEETKKNTPVQLVEEAVAHKNRRDCLADDVFWVVYDRESIAKYSNELHEKAMRLAKRNGVNVAISNVCFELWILLHFVKNSASYTSFTDLMNSSALRKELAKIGIQKYDKGEKKVFDLIGGDIGIARMNARDMNAQTKAAAQEKMLEPYLLNPYTEVNLLLDAIDEFD
ncbi:RloB family protein [Janthinobacterium sp. SUN206]|jgi:hypothetical protein|uniref:RloB family protein n=1 Tax=Janthinobacterium sp. SUN206 TaxID=3014787 RepID=UPI0027132039|nr:RloB family protein [Janthinobacterium sp. SUN206]MDO8067919.1 RloB family protein [Janthinobacterium sp. SUN206]